MLRLWLAVVSTSLGAAALYALGGYVTVIGDGQLGNETPSLWSFIIPGFAIGLLCSVFFLAPIYLLVCRRFKKHRGYFFGLAATLWLFFSIMFLYFMGIDVHGVSSIAIAVFPVGAISAIVFSLAVGPVNEKPSP
jgi:hypothetical protein